MSSSAPPWRVPTWQPATGLLSGLVCRLETCPRISSAVSAKPPEARSACTSGPVLGRKASLWGAAQPALLHSDHQVLFWSYVVSSVPSHLSQNVVGFLSRTGQLQGRPAPCWRPVPRWPVTAPDAVRQGWGWRAFLLGLSGSRSEEASRVCLPGSGP